MSEMMNNTLLRKEDLKVGMKVSDAQLREIFDTYIFMIHCEMDGDNVIGEIAYISDEPFDSVDDKIHGNGATYAFHQYEDDLDSDNEVYGYE